MSESRGQNEPSMEEILASIRKIISEDAPEESAERKAQQDEDAAEAQSDPQKEGVGGEAAADDGVLDLTRMVEDDGRVVELVAGESGASAERDDDAEETAEMVDSDTHSEEETAMSAASPDEQKASAGKQKAGAGEQKQQPSGGEQEALVSEETSASTEAALSEVARTVRQGRAQDQGPLGGDSTLEKLVREALQPHLKGWLDENLETLVERVVREEVRRLARRVEDE